MSKDCESGPMPCRSCYPHASGGLYKRALHNGILPFAVFFQRYAAHRLLFKQPPQATGHSAIWHEHGRPFELCVPACRFKVLDDLRGVELECKLQSLSFALAGGSRIDILGPPG